MDGMPWTWAEPEQEHFPYLGPYIFRPEKRRRSDQAKN